MRPNRLGRRLVRFRRLVARQILDQVRRAHIDGKCPYDSYGKIFWKERHVKGSIYALAQESLSVTVRLSTGLPGTESRLSAQK